MHQEAPPTANPKATVRPLYQGGGLAAVDYRCCCGPGDASHVEQHGAYTLALVRDGSFLCRTRGRVASLMPGALFLGAPGQEFACFHDYGVGDRCTAWSLDAALVDELAAAYGWSTGVEDLFEPVAVMTSPRGIMLAPLADAAMDDGDGDGVASVVAGLFGALAEAVHARTQSRAPRRLARADLRRAHDLARLLAGNPDGTWTIDALAEGVGLGRFALIRAFTAAVGVAPYRYLMMQRLGRAARLLTTTAWPVTEVAAAAGFSDLSNFQNKFRAVMGVSPGAFRRGVAR